VTWQNPYSATPWTGGATGLPASFDFPLGRIGVAPDNDFHQLSFDGSYDISYTTHAALSASLGRMSQNEGFLPYTITPGLVSTPLPRSSLEGEIDTRFLLGRLSLRPTRALSVVASVRYDERDNRTPQSEFIYVGGDIQLQPPPASDSDRIRTNLARSWRKMQGTLEASYRLPEARTLVVGIGQEQIHRTFAEVERTDETAYRVELRQGSAGAWNGSIGYDHLTRRGTQYEYNAPYLAAFTSPAFIAAQAAANGCTDLLACVRLGPLQQKFFLADRDPYRGPLT